MRGRTVLLYMVFSLGLASCMPASRKPQLVASGSSTLAPMMELLLEEYAAGDFPGTVSLDSIGTRAGFQRLLEGSCQIVTASRPITPEEMEAAKMKGIQPIGFVLAMDAVAVVTGGKARDGLSLRTVKSLLTADRWADVDSSWPDEPVAKYYPGQDSGTFAFVVGSLFDGDARPILTSGGLQFSEDDHVLAQGVSGDPHAVGFFGYSYYLDNRDRLSLFAIDGYRPEDGGEYPLSRPLFLYLDAARVGEDPYPADFVAFALDRVASGDLPRGFSAPSPETIRSECGRLSSLTEGRLF